ncbi:MAG: nucleotidyltransferase domain-containing protein [Trueperaceae bacterium]
MIITTHDLLGTTQLIATERYSDAQLVLLAGSVARGEGTPTSDLDLVVVTKNSEAPYRESFLAYHWPVEAFVHTTASLETYFHSDAQRRRPTLAHMCFEGLFVLGDAKLNEHIKEKAKVLLEAGPAKLSEAELAWQRYMLTDALDDFIGSRHYAEALFVVGPLITLLCDFIFDTRNHWRSTSKRNFRMLETLDPKLHGELLAGLEAFYKEEKRESLIGFIEKVLEPFGGRLFAGYKVGGKRK